MVTPNASTSDNCAVTKLIWSATGATTLSSALIGINNVGTQIFNTGVTIVTYTVADAAGNAATCSFSVTVTDNIVPSINCPSNYSVGTSVLSCDTLLSNSNPITADNCVVSSLNWSMNGATTLSSALTGINNVSTQLFNNGITVVTYTISDAAGNSSSCSYNVTILDMVKPIINTTANMTISTDIGICTAAINIPVSIISDNCSVAKVIWGISGSTIASSSSVGINQIGLFVFNKGISIITYTASDVSGNTKTNSFTITVNDNELPLFLSGPSTIQTCNPVVSFSVPIVTDNCSLVSLLQTDGTGLTSGSTFPTGTTTLIYTATDATGNSSTYNFNIVVSSLPTNAIAGLDRTIYSNSITLNANSPLVGVGNWTELSGIGQITNATNPTTSVMNIGIGENIFEWRITFGSCPFTSDTIKITYKPLLFPEIITPNNDGSNDILEIKGLSELGKAKISIFNRWGGLEFQTDDYQNNWAGTNIKNEPLTDDTYFYVLELFNSEIIKEYIVIKRN